MSAKKIVSVKLIPLGQSPDDANLPLQWTLDLWGDHIPGFSRQDWIDFYQSGKEANFNNWTGDGQELIFIGKQGDEIVGAISLVDFDDLEEFRHLTPWVAAFIVNPQLRGGGIGSQMLALLEKQARQYGIGELHLWTEDKSQFYQNRGYSPLAAGSLGNLRFDVLRKALSRECSVD
jgi:GNAT superfamily N-acetyltransferase